MPPTIEQYRAHRKKNGIKSLVNPEEDLDETTTDPGPAASDDEEEDSELSDANVAAAYEADLSGTDEDVETPPVAQAKPAAEETAYTPPSREEFETYKEYKKAADEYKELRQAFGNNPTGTTLAYFNAMDETQKAEFVRQVQAITQSQTNPMGINIPQAQQAQPQQARLDDYDESLATGVEKAVAHNLDWITSGPQKVQEYVTKLVDGSNNQLATRAQTYIDYQTAKVEQKLDAVMQLLDLKLEEPTADEIDKLVRTGKPVRDAVKELYSPKVAQAIAAKKVVEKRTPRTPGNGSSVPTRLPKNADFAQVAASILGRNLN